MVIMIEKNSDSRTALYKVKFDCEGQTLEIDLILEVKKHNKRAVKRMLSTLTNQRYDMISRIKLHFRKDVHGFTPNVQGIKEYNQKLQREKEARIALGQRRRIYSRFYLKNNPYQPNSNKVEYTRHLFVDMNDLQEHIKAIHQYQKLQFRFDLQVGLTLRNIQTGELRSYYPSLNTSFFYEDGLPMINQSIDNLLEQITFENIIEKVKRENSQWAVDDIYEYVILITPVPGILIGSNIKLPKYIKDTKSIIGLEGVKNNMCFWHCLAHYMDTSGRNDRLVKKANKLFEEYYKSKPTEVYGGFDIDELENVESHFKVCINIYSINSRHVEIERLSNLKYPKSMNLNLYTEPNTDRHHFSFIKHVKNIIKVFKCYLFK